MPRCLPSLLLALALLVVPAISHAQQTLPPGFIENRGQLADLEGNARPDLLFLLRQPGVQLYLRTTGLSYVFNRVESSFDSTSLFRTHRVDIEFVGANATAPVERSGGSVGYTNYYLPHCPDGVLGVRDYNEVVYRNLYPGIDLRLRVRENGAVKSEWIVRPGADPSLIHLRYVATDSLGLQAGGALRMATAIGGVEENAPESYTTRGEEHDVVESRYQLDGDDLRFLLGSYDRSRTLVIDPLSVAWATYVGGESNEEGIIDVAAGPDRSVYLTGGTISSRFPTTPGAFQEQRGNTTRLRDAFIAKFTVDGQRIWSTYYGGSLSEDHEALAISGSGDVALTGSTSSIDFPVSNGAFQSTRGGEPATLWSAGFIVLFDRNGARQWGTYLGGVAASPIPVYTIISSVSFDRAENLVVTGTTNALDFPVTPGEFQSTFPGTMRGDTAPTCGFVSKFSHLGGMRWSTFMASPDGSTLGSVRIDAGDSIYLSGSSPAGFPTTPGTYLPAPSNGGTIVVKLDSGGGMLWSTYFLTAASGFSATSLCLDPHGNPVVGGSGRATATTPGVYQPAYGGGASDVYVGKLSSDGTRLLWGTELGGSAAEPSVWLASDPFGNITAMGWTSSPDFPVTLNAYRRTYINAPYDAYITRLDSSGRGLWSTYFGRARNGTLNVGEDDILSLGLDSLGGILVAGLTNSITFPVTPGAFQSTSGGYVDAFLLRLDCGLPPPDVTGAGSVCWNGVDSIFTLTASAGYRDYRWNTGETTPTIRTNRPGTYSVTVTDSNGCWAVRTVIVDRPNPPQVNITATDTVLCWGDSLLLDAAPLGTYTYQWSTNESTPQIVVRDSGTYSVIVIDTNGCRDTALVHIRLYPKETLTISPRGTIRFCGEDSVVVTAPVRFISYRWSTGDTTSSIVVKATGTYTLTAIDSSGCLLRDSLVALAAFDVGLVSESGTLNLCGLDSIVLRATPAGAASYRWSTGESSETITVRTEGNYWVVASDAAGCRDSASVEVVSTLPTPPHLSGPAFLCAGDSLLLDAGPGYRTYRWSTGDTTRTLMVRTGGDYSVDVRDNTNCHGSSDTLHLLVIAPIIPTVTSSGLTLQSSAAPSYQWSFNGAPIAGATAQSFAPLDSGDYTVTVIDSNGCTGTSAPYHYGGEFTGSGSLVIGSYSAAPGASVSITPTLTSTTIIAEGMHYTLRLRYARTLLAPGSGVASVNASQAEREIEVKGVLQAGTTGAELQLDPIPMTATLGRVESTTLTPTLLTIDEAPRLRLDTLAGSFTLTGLCTNGGTRLVEATGETVLKVWQPNPASDNATIDYEMIESGPMRLLLVDAIGREVATIAEGVQVAGRFRVETDVRQLANGAYTCVLVTPTEVRRQQVRVTR